MADEPPPQNKSPEVGDVTHRFLKTEWKLPLLGQPMKDSRKVIHRHSVEHPDAQKAPNEVNGSAKNSAHSTLYPRNKPHSGHSVGPVAKVVRQAGQVISAAPKSKTMSAAST